MFLWLGILTLLDKAYSRYQQISDSYMLQDTQNVALEIIFALLYNIFTFENGYLSPQ